MATTLFRFFPRDTIQTATVQHVGTSAGKQDYAAASETVAGALVQLTRYQRALMGPELRIKHVFYIEEEANVLESDKLTINGVTYKVAFVDTYPYGTVRHRAAMLTTP